MIGDTVRRTIDMVKGVCVHHGIEPLMTVTSVSDRCFDLTVPILFPQSDETRIADARRCFRQLLHEGRQIGVAPYRTGAESMTLLTEPTPYWRMVSTIKESVDPNQIVAPVGIRPSVRPRWLEAAPVS
jgi:4-cresol dehydrogenase (hydroxylating) flavoprotein subunit